MQKFQVFQSLWVMERRQPDGFERSLEENIAMIADAHFDGISGLCNDRDAVRRLHAQTKPHKHGIEGLCFPKTVDELKPALEIAHEFEIAHLNLQSNLRPRRLQDCIPVLEGWRRPADESKVPVLIETHRDRMTTDYFSRLIFLIAFLTSGFSATFRTIW